MMCSALKTRVFDTAFAHLGLDKTKVNVEVYFSTKRAIKRLNAIHRASNKVTDVLSFPNLDLKPGELPSLERHKTDINPESGKLELGTIFICTRIAKRQAKHYGHSLDRELGFLALHGLLHLLGYTHDTPEDEEQMIKLQEEILDKLGLSREVS